jgi:hypothetical protein
VCAKAESLDAIDPDAVFARIQAGA